VRLIHISDEGYGVNGITAPCDTFLWHSEGHRDAWCDNMRTLGKTGASAADEWRPCEVASELNVTHDPREVTCLICLAAVAAAV
jgi:hypothetical protein